MELWSLHHDQNFFYKNLVSYRADSRLKVNKSHFKKLFNKMHIILKYKWTKWAI